ncbi:MAG TPA: alanine--glyoxylate aminotransferase family protein [Candidatus Binatia bacterium]|nr:alanine--glyoxylate aminotransferase family protein [Candidatus Binatia bacterium]
MKHRPLKNYLLAPGPTAVPAEVLLELASPTIHHRTPEFEKIVAGVRDRLKAVFETEQDVMVLAASGTGAMEAAVTNTLSPGDAVLCVNGGKFGERWVKICRTFGLDVEELTVEWGRAVDPAAVEAALKRRPELRAVLMQASETSTTVLHPVEPIARLTRDRDTLLIVDGITAVGVTPMPMDRWGIDVLVSGSQKAFMLPPGLAFIALSERAWRFGERAKLPRFYFDLRRERENLHKNTTAYTPAINLIYGLAQALDRMIDDGLEQIFARCDRLMRATRAGAQGIGLELVAKENPSPAVTGIFTPPGVDGGALQKYLRYSLGVEVAGGQDQYKGKILRLAHLGFTGEFDVVTGLAAIEMALSRFGAEVAFGRGVGRAQAILAEALPPAGARA